MKRKYMKKERKDVGKISESVLINCKKITKIVQLIIISYTYIYKEKQKEIIETEKENKITTE